VNKASLTSAVLALGVVAIGALSVWVADFSAKCAGDGCIGGAVPALVMLGLLAAQLAVVLPTYALARHRRKLPVLAPAVAWALVSILAFYLPTQLIHR